MCKVSVQGERARGEVLHMGMEGCSAAPIGFSGLYGWWYKTSGEKWAGGGGGYVSVQDERASECASREELHMGMGGCSAAPIGCCLAQIQ